MKRKLKTDLESFKHLLDTLEYSEVEGNEKYSKKTYFVNSEENENTGNIEFQLIWTQEPLKRNNFQKWDNWAFFDEKEKRISDIA